MSQELFHGWDHPKYQTIEIYHEFQYRCLPKPVQQLLNAHYAIITNDNLSSGEGYDYKLEAANRSGLKSEMARPTERIIDVSAAIHRWRTVLREKRYLKGLMLQCRLDPAVLDWMMQFVKTSSPAAEFSTSTSSQLDAPLVS